MGKLIIIFSLVVIFNPTLCQNRDSITSDGVNKKRLHTFILVGSSAYAISLIALNQLWYNDFPREGFHFFDDSEEWKQMDKLGHFYSSYHIGLATTKALQWSGLPEKKSYLWGAVSGFLILLPIEVFDGFSSQYGASAGDIVANALGPALLLGQYAAWREIRIHPKFSFSRSSYAELRPEVLGEGFQEEFIKDYNGQTYWLSFDIYKFLNSNTNFPKWLNISVGYGAENLLSARDSNNISMGFDPYRQYFLALDFDFTHFSQRRNFTKVLFHLLNMIHIPAPTLEYNRQNGFVFHFLYF